MRQNVWRFVSIALLATVLLAVLTGCAAKPANGQADAKDDNEAVVGLANPVEQYKTLAEAEKAAGFKFTVPEGVNVNGSDYEQYYWSTINRELIEVRYGAAKNEVCYLRKAAYSKDSEDISGDYNVYDDVKTVPIGLEDGRETTVTLKGKDGKFYVATWQLKGAKDNGVWSYAAGAQGIPEEDLVELVKMIE